MKPGSKIAKELPGPVTETIETTGGSVASSGLKTERTTEVAASLPVQTGAI